MKERTTVRLGRAWWLLTMGLLVLTVVLGILSSGEEPADWFSTAVLIGMTGFATVGASPLSEGVPGAYGSLSRGPTDDVG